MGHYDENEDWVYDKLPPEIKAQWIKDLRSGEFKQAKGRLKGILKGGRVTRHCCLGVLADRQGALKPYEGSDDSEYTFTMDKSRTIYKDLWQIDDPDDDASVGFLPPCFMEKVNLDESAQDHLTDMNDNGASFAKIANWIEANL